jgi:transcriptional regulator with XRE-family HTH domain
VSNKSDLDDFLAEELADPDTRARFDEIAPLVDFGWALGIAREQRRMSVRALADAAGIQRKAILQMEKGNEAPTLVEQTKLARALNARLEVSAHGRIEFVLFPQPVTQRAAHPPDALSITRVARAKAG